MSRLLTCFDPPQTTVNELLQRWASNGVSTDAKRLSNELQDATTKFLDRTTGLGAEGADVARLDRLAIESSEIIMGIAQSIRQKLLEWMITNIGQSLNDTDEGNNAEDEDLRLANEACYIVAICIIKADPLSPFETYNKANSRSFISVARIGATGLIREIIRELETYLTTTPDPDNMSLKDSIWLRLNASDKSNNTALLEAAKENRVQTIDALLIYEDRLADHLPVLNSVITNDNCRAFEKISQYRPSWIAITTLRRSIQEASSHNITEYLLQRDPTLIDDNIMKLVVEKNDPSLWETVKWYCQDRFRTKTCAILHDAVKNRRIDIVQHVVQNAPNLATVLRKNHYALWYNSRETGKIDLEVVEIDSRYEDRGDSKPFPYTETEQGSLEKISQKIEEDCKTIRDLLVPVVIRLTEPVMIQKILRESNVIVNEICLPLSSFNATAHDFILFVKRLIQKDERQAQNSSGPQINGEIPTSSNGRPVSAHSHQTYSSEVAEALKFEPVLRYADFPDLNSTFLCTPDDYRVDYSEVLDVFKWLKRKKRVTEIVEVKVADRLHVPHNDEAVRYCVEEFNVKILNWRKLDLCLADIDPRDTLQTLHLYSSGNMAVVGNWLSEHDKGGVVRIKNLKKLYIHVVEDVLSNSRVRDTEQLFQSKFEQLKTDLSCTWDFKVQTERWIKPKVEGSGKTLKEIVEISFGEIAPFVEKYKMEHLRQKTSQSPAVPYRRTKVCLIDSGVIVVENNTPENGERKLHIGSQIVDGKSFVYDGFSESPWWYASVPHGTQMASLLCSIDPCCDLYVAKVGDAIGQYVGPKNAPVTPERVADAVKWAVSKDVDIIVLCLVMTRTTSNDQLSSAFEQASEKNIVVICSTADAGRNWKDTWPAKFGRTEERSGFDNILGIGACDEDGNRMDETQDKGYPYQFKGKNVYVGNIPFVESEELVTGSSVATAIAAGIASLTLSCCRLANNEVLLIRRGRFETIIKKFKNMSKDTKDPRYVRLQEFVLGRERAPFTESSNLDDALNREFGPSSPLSVRHDE